MHINFGVKGSLEIFSLFGCCHKVIKLICINVLYIN